MGSQHLVQVATRAPGQSWGSATSVNSAWDTRFLPRVALDASGSVAVTWLSGTAGPGSVTGASILLTALDRTAPTATVGVPSTGTTGTAVAFTATVGDLFSAPVDVTWDFGDGATGAGTSVSHTYATAGDRTVTVVATDASGNATTLTRSISVSAPPPAPPAPPSDPAPPAAPEPTPPSDDASPAEPEPTMI